MKKKQGKGRVFIGLSGGVDSAVAAALLLEQGYEVIPVFYKCWEELNAELSCPWREDQEAAFKVAKTLGIDGKFRTWNFTEEFTRGVIEKLAEVARAGGTGNPDIDCNRIVKFGLFFARALAAGADFIATGHYARVARHTRARNHAKPDAKQHENFLLLRARCAAKNDQTYFLAQAITQEILSRTLFPVGEFESKEAVRAEARRRGLPCADRRSSRGICLVGKDGEKADYAALLKQFIPPQQGAVMTTSGVRVGTHEGVPFYTRGQRTGLGLTRAGGGPFYVVGKDAQQNIVHVAPPAEAQEQLFNSEAVLEDAHWIMGRAPAFPFHCEAFVRHPQNRTVCCTVTQLDTGQNTAKHRCVGQCSSLCRFAVKFEEPQRALTPGQSVVFYGGDIVLGGAIIKDLTSREPIG